ncbi:hypothetical protein Bbelb_424030 [Branchiostoma belcheri]|nr:hypothetical protein Bbelb_424030 [Branchiostoma belcheri]
MDRSKPAARSATLPGPPEPLPFPGDRHGTCSMTLNCQPEDRLLVILFYKSECPPPPSSHVTLPGDTITNMTGGGLPEVNPGTQPARSLQHGTAAENTLPPHKVFQFSAPNNKVATFRALSRHSSGFIQGPYCSQQLASSTAALTNAVVPPQSELPGAVVSDVWPRAGCYSLSVIPEQKCPADVCKGRFKHGVIAMATGTPGDVTYALFAESSAAFL